MNHPLEAALLECESEIRQRLLELRRRRHEELHRKLQQAARPSAAIARRAQSAAVQLSFAQEGLWFLDQLTGSSVRYNIPRALRLSGRLDAMALQSALRVLVERHESLRTGFEPRDGVAVQVVHEAAQASALLQLVTEQAPGSSLAEREQAIQAWLRAGAAEPFDLKHAPLLRSKLLRLDDQEHVLLLVVHHIVADGWSMGILERELGALYAAFCAGQPNPLAALPIQFADYAVWQRQRLEGPSAEGDLAYWREQLKDLQVLQLPTDRMRAARPNYHGSCERFEIEPSVLAELKALARRENVTLYMLLLGAFQVLLMRYSGQHDVVVGSPVAGRHRTELEGLIGYFVNTLVLRSDLSGSPSFVKLLARVRQVCLDAYAHQELPFDRLVAELSPERDLSRNPLYQVLFTLQNTPASALALGELHAQRLPTDNATAKFDLALSLTEHDAALAGVLEYSTQLFDASTIERVARHYQRLLRAIAAHPEQSIARLPLMDEREREQLLFTWNDSAREYPLHQNLHQLFEAQVLRCPQAPAVILDDEPLSYDELNRRANRLAHHLRTIGVGPDVLVGLCLRRSHAMVVALLGILKAGGAYVPLDPQYPRERVAFMLSDSAAPVVITEKSLREQLPEIRAHVLCIDSDWHRLAQLPDANPTPLATQDHLAYVIYTSGSTGTPKGVAVPQRAVRNFLASMAREPGLTSTDRLLAVTTLSFDISVLELLLPLSVGAQLVLANDDQPFDGHALRVLLDGSAISVMQATPTTWRMLIDAGWQGSPTFKALIGGESLPQDLAQQLLERTGSVWNMFGPTETTVWSTCWKVATPEQGISIGRPIANTQVHVLDEDKQLTPIGVSGEIYIGGDGVTLGYLHRPELTAERFIDDPFKPGRKLYRTGDRGRWRHEGLLEHQGRLDSQVKVRGHRIELGEIESNLMSHERVARAVAIVREDQPGDVRVVAYIVAKSSMPPVGELHERIRAKLPNYMLPQHYIELDVIPLLPNGKIDRKALPPPGEAGTVSSQTVIAPRNDAEAAVAEVWKRLLRIEHVSVNDNFFDLGGHSLLAAQAVNEIEERLGVRVGVRRMVTETLGQIASSAAPRQPNAPLEPKQRRGWLRRLIGRRATA